MNNELERNDNAGLDSLVKQISNVQDVLLGVAAHAINLSLTARNWLIGFYIVHYEQKGEDRAKYGEKTLQKLSEKLNKKSLSYRNLRLYRQFYLEFTSLEKPIFDYVLHEFAGEKTLLTGIKNNLIEDKTASKDGAVQKERTALIIFKDKRNFLC